MADSKAHIIVHELSKKLGHPTYAQMAQELGVSVATIAKSFNYPDKVLTNEVQTVMDGNYLRLLHKST